MNFCIDCGKQIASKNKNCRCGKCYYRWRVGKNHHGWKGGEIERSCKQCEKVFYIVPSQVKWGGGKFCSQKCFHEWHRKQNHGMWKPKITRICPICKKEYQIYPSGIRRKYCSFHCRNIVILREFGTQKTSSLEKMIRLELKKNTIPHFHQAQIKDIAVVDFLLPNKIILQCDGSYWHSKPGVKERDNRQDFLLTFAGYKVFRFTEEEIRKSPSKCIQKLTGACYS